MRSPRFRTIALLTALAAASACSEELAPPEPDRSTIDAGRFTSAMSDLVVARIEMLPDSAAYRARAAEILKAHEISEEDLWTFADVHGQNDDMMSGAYARIEARLDSLYPTGQAVTELDSLFPSNEAADSAAPAP